MMPYVLQRKKWLFSCALYHSYFRCCLGCNGHALFFGALLAVFAIIWDALISYRKVKAIKVKFLWGILSIQGIGITLLLIMKTSTASIVLLLLAIQIISLVATLIIGRKTD